METEVLIKSEPDSSPTSPNFFKHSAAFNRVSFVSCLNKTSHHHNGDQATRHEGTYYVRYAFTLILNYDESCTIVQGINSEPVNVLSKVL